MARRLLITVALAVVTLWGVSVVTFFGMQTLPGNEAQAILGQSATPSSIAELNAQLGLNRPILDRYGSWLSGIVHGQFGNSSTGTPVWQIVSPRVTNTLVLAGATIALLVPLSLALGIIAAKRPGRLVDNVITTTSLVFVSVPEFVIGSLLVLLFAVGVGLLPAVSLVNPGESVLLQPKILVLPVITLLVAALAGTIRMVRAFMIGVLSSDYVEMARLKGVPERTVLLRHALPNAVGPTLQIFALNVGWLAGGIVVVETVFQYPGLGSELTTAVGSRDLPTVEAIVMLICAVYIAANLLADVGATLLNPRLRRQR
jgi:peptide/nickel transport system permease protein